MARIVVAATWTLIMLMRSYGFGRMFSPGRLLLTASASSSSTTSSSAAKQAASDGKLMPVTVLSGFLGAGKTSFLQHVIGTSDESKRKYGLVVNDMATVNVDSKLIKAQSGSFDGIDTMELQNGCVCCTLAEDLMASVSRLVSLSEAKGVGYDHIVVECSGIAEPRKIRELFQEAEDLGSSLTARIKLDTLITLVDATVFLDLYGSADADLETYSQLAVAKDDVEGQAALANEGSGQRRVTELLLEQVECADVVLINKCDLLKRPGDEALVRKIIASINPTARVLTSVRGVLQGSDAATGGAGAPSLLGSAGGEGAASWGVLDEHRRVVAAVNQANCDGGVTCKDPTHDHDHSHSHEHEHKNEAEACDGGATCNDPSHNHDHSHSHDHGHKGAAAAACSNPTCNDPTHDHDHSHSHDHDQACDGGVTCNDPTHNHDHSHSHSHDHSQATTALDRFGITSFVYQRRRPFHPARFSLFLQSLGKLSVDGIAELSEQPLPSSKQKEEAAAGAEATTLAAARRALLRSKGFVWMGTSSAAAYFMSHAGQYLELVVLGRWWADIPKSEWPAGSESEITVDFSGQYGDRRQELVFIGQFAGVGGKSQQALEEVLDTCLLTDEEMAQYEATVASKKGDEALRKLFFPTP